MHLTPITKKMPKLTSLRLASRRSTSATCIPTVVRCYAERN